MHLIGILKKFSSEVGTKFIKGLSSTYYIIPKCTDCSTLVSIINCFYYILREKHMSLHAGAFCLLPHEVDEPVERRRFGSEGPGRQLAAVDQVPAVSVSIVALDGHGVVTGERAGGVETPAACCC